MIAKYRMEDSSMVLNAAARRNGWIMDQRFRCARHGATSEKRCPFSGCIKFQISLDGRISADKRTTNKHNHEFSSYKTDEEVKIPPVFAIQHRDMLLAGVKPIDAAQNVLTKMADEGYASCRTSKSRELLMKKLKNKTKTIKKKEGMQTHANDVGDLLAFVKQHSVVIPEDFLARQCCSEDDISALAKELHSKKCVNFIHDPTTDLDTCESLHHLPFFVPLPARGGTEEEKLVHSLLVELNRSRTKSTTVEEVWNTTYVMTTLTMLKNVCDNKRLSWYSPLCSDGTAEMATPVHKQREPGQPSRASKKKTEDTLDWVIMWTGYQSFFKNLVKGQNTISFAPLGLVVCLGERTECVYLGLKAKRDICVQLFGADHDISEHTRRGVLDGGQALRRGVGMVCPNALLYNDFIHCLRKFMSPHVSGNGGYVHKQYTPRKLKLDETFVTGPAYCHAKAMGGCKSRPMFETMGEKVMLSWTNDYSNANGCFLASTFEDHYFDKDSPTSHWHYTAIGIPGFKPEQQAQESLNNTMKSSASKLRQNAGTMLKSELPKIVKSMSLRQSQVRLEYPGQEKDAMLTNEEKDFFKLIEGNVDANVYKFEDESAGYLVNGEPGLPIFQARVDEYMNLVHKGVFDGSVAEMHWIGKSFCHVKKRKVPGPNEHGRQKEIWMGDCQGYYSRGRCEHCCPLQYSPECMQSLCTRTSASRVEKEKQKSPPNGHHKYKEMNDFFDKFVLLKRILLTWLSDGTRKAQEKLVFEPIDNQEALKLKNYMTQPDFQWKVAIKQNAFRQGNQRQTLTITFVRKCESSSNNNRATVASEATTEQQGESTRV